MLNFFKWFYFLVIVTNSAEMKKKIMLTWQLHMLYLWYSSRETVIWNSDLFAWVYVISWILNDG